MLAFHEGFADLVALFQRFSYQELLADAIQKDRGNLGQKQGNALVKLAQQFGQATGLGKELRSALDVPAGDVASYRNAIEPHLRGSILVSAVFDAFFTTYKRRIADLIRIATGGTGILGDGDLLPDLANRFAHEALRASQSTLGMCIRAFDYLPPVDIRYGDYLRALVTADYELSPEDEFGNRSAMIEAFRARGVYADGVISLAEESLFWPLADEKFPKMPTGTIEMMNAANAFSRSNKKDGEFSENTEGTELDVTRQVANRLWQWANGNRSKLLLEPNLKVEVHGFHIAFRVSTDGQLLSEMVVQFAQADRTNLDQRGGLPLRGGTTVVAAADGTVRYVIAKPLPSRHLSREQQKLAKERVARQAEYLAKSDGADPKMANFTEAELKNRMRARGNLAALHLG